MAVERRPQQGFRGPHAVGWMHGAAEELERNRRRGVDDKRGRDQIRQQILAGSGDEYGRSGHRSRLELRRALAASTLLAASATPALRRVGGFMAGACWRLAAHRTGPFALHTATHWTDTLTGSLDSKNKTGGQPQHGHARAQQSPTAPAAGTTAFYVRACIQTVPTVEGRAELRFLQLAHCWSIFERLACQAAPTDRAGVGRRGVGIPLHTPPDVMPIAESGRGKWIESGKESGEKTPGQRRGYWASARAPR